LTFIYYVYNEIEVWEYFLKILLFYLLNKISNMAEFEGTEEVIDEITEIDNDYEDNNETELTVDDYQKEKTRREKAEKALVELKKQLKDKQQETSLDEKSLDLREELTDFLANNKDLKEYKTDLIKYRKQGFTLKQAVALVENDDITIENRKKANLNISDWEWTWKNVYSYDELEKMSQSDYNKIKGLQLQWKVKFKN